MIDWFQNHIPAWVYITIIMHLVILGGVAYLILLERKIASWVQDRIGPNRVGLGGLLPLVLLPLAPFINIDRITDKARSIKMMGFGQPLADGLKFIVKEDYQPAGVDKVLFTVAPGMMVIVIIISIAVLPWGGTKQGTRVIPATEMHLANADVAALQNAQPGTPEYENALAAVRRTLPSSEHIVEGSIKPATIGAPSAQPNAIQVTYRWAFQIADLNIGVLFILASLSLAVYGVVIGGWASNNKYSFLGGLRATANMISYEIPLGLAVLCIVLMYGSLDLGTIVDKQAGYWLGFIPAWNVFTQPLAFVMFLVCIHAEANRAPFDLAEAEQELVGGYHTEYSSMRFALFFLGEYAGMVTTSAVCVALFFGGWHLPWIEYLWPALRGNVDAGHPAITTSLLACVVRTLVFLTKTLAVIFVFMWVRWSLPRFRFDQLMMLAWRALIPISLLLVMVTSVVVYFFGGEGSADGQRIGGWMALCLLVVNVIMGLMIAVISLRLPPAPETNRRVRVTGSRFQVTPLPATAAARG